MILIKLKMPENVRKRRGEMVGREDFFGREDEAKVVAHRQRMESSNEVVKHPPSK